MPYYDYHLKQLSYHAFFMFCNSTTSHKFSSIVIQVVNIPYPLLLCRRRRRRRRRVVYLSSIGHSWEPPRMTPKTRELTTDDKFQKTLTHQILENNRGWNNKICIGLMLVSKPQ